MTFNNLHIFVDRQITNVLISLFNKWAKRWNDVVKGRQFQTGVFWAFHDFLSLLLPLSQLVWNILLPTAIQVVFFNSASYSFEWPWGCITVTLYLSHSTNINIILTWLLWTVGQIAATTKSSDIHGTCECCLTSYWKPPFWGSFSKTTHRN